MTPIETIKAAAANARDDAEAAVRAANTILETASDKGIALFALADLDRYASRLSRHTAAINAAFRQARRDADGSYERGTVR